MPRKQRVEVSGGIHHVSARGVNKQDIFVDEEDRLGYLLMLAATVEECGWLCLGYCLMPNHVHLLIETPEPNLGAGMQLLHGQYGRSFNRHHRRDGHLFKGRYYQQILTEEDHFVTTVGYIAVNPVKARLCSTPSRWPWGSHSRVVAGDPPKWLAHEHLLDHFEAITGVRCYDEVIATATRALLTQT